MKTDDSIRPAKVVGRIKQCKRSQCLARAVISPAVSQHLTPPEGLAQPQALGSSKAKPHHRSLFTFLQLCPQGIPHSARPFHPHFPLTLTSTDTNIHLLSPTDGPLRPLQYILLASVVLSAQHPLFCWGTDSSPSRVVLEELCPSLHRVTAGKMWACHSRAPNLVPYLSVPSDWPLVDM